VDEVASKPERYAGTVSLGGVVYHVSAKEQTVVLISEEEFAECGTQCPELLLPVRWVGRLPRKGDKVRVTGRIEKTARGSLFLAAEAEILAASKNNGR